MVDRYDYADYVRDYLADIFAEEPYAEIVDEVLGYLELHDGITDEEIVRSIESICDEMFG